MAGEISHFYDELANDYHLMFEDWERTIGRQAAVLGPLLAGHSAAGPLRLLDCACGIGTQALGFAAMGHSVVASDLSPAAIERARKEAAAMSLQISFHVSDMTSLREIDESDFDAVVVLDNALPHLTPRQLSQAIAAIAAKLRQDGLFMASIRDYDDLVLEKPAMQPPSFYGAAGSRRIVHQVWDWIDDDGYVLHVYITTQSGEEWRTHHFVGKYRCLLRAELSSALRDAGFADVRWLTPAESGFYQPIVLAKLVAAPPRPKGYCDV